MKNKPVCWGKPPGNENPGMEEGLGAGQVRGIFQPRGKNSRGKNLGQQPSPKQ